MPLGLRFLYTPKKNTKKSSSEDAEVRRTSEGDSSIGYRKVARCDLALDEIELKSLSDPLLNLSPSSIEIHVRTVPGVTSSAPTLLLEEIENATGGDSVDDVKETDPEIEEPNPVDISEMTASYFDRNGNPVDENEEVPQPMLVAPVIPPQPKCFINAAALLDEEPEYVPSPPVSLLLAKVSPQVGPSCLGKLKFDIGPPAPPSPAPSSTTSSRPSSSGIPRRVPISKSFPDIIQTTLKQTNSEQIDFMQPAKSKNLERERAVESKYRGPTAEDLCMIADSLEDLRRSSANLGDTVDSNSGPALQAFANHLPKVFERIEPIMVESIMVGISNEKPPETWVVDFNSFTMDGDEMIDPEHPDGIETPMALPTHIDLERQKSTSSNTSSLAYFLSMDEVDSESESVAQKELATSSDSMSKKIFSMFVDIGKDKETGIPKNFGYNSSITNNGNRNHREAAARLRELPPSGIPKYPGPLFGYKGMSSGSGGKSMSSSMVVSCMSEPEVGPFGINGSSNRSSLHVANIDHDASFSSSMLSSMEMSALGDPEVSQGGLCFKLGMDLLRMFQESINTDVNISVRGRYVKAHKCILASRSQYFAALLSGNWIQKAGNTIHLDEFSYNTVQFTMYHIYSGTNEIPESIDLMELASLTDMLGLEGLREVISQTIRTRFCHNFHRPCTGCIGGNLEFLPLAVNYGMEELHRKMIKWICKHFIRIWPTKAFSTLGDDLTDKCLRFSVNHLSPENLLDVTLGCDQLLSTMPTVRWTERVFSIVTQLNDACVQYVGENFSQVLQSQRFSVFGKGQTWNIPRIENTFTGGILLLKPDEACLSHIALCRLLELGTRTIDEVEWSMIFVDFLKMLRREVEKFLLGNASKAVLSKNWESLSQDVRKRICSTSFLGTDKAGSKIKPQHHVKTNPASVQAAVVTSGTTASSAGRHSRPTSSGGRQTQAPSMGSNFLPTAIHTISKALLVRTPSPPPEVPSPPRIVESKQKSVSTTKSIASVRPMPSSQPQTPAAPAPKLPNVYSSGRSGTTAPVATGRCQTSSVATTPTQQSKVTANATASTLSSRKKSVVNASEKERSFGTASSSRVSSAGNPTRRDSVGSKPAACKTSSPNTPSTSNKSFASKTPTAAYRRAIQDAQPTPPPPKATFLTNSEKAKAVSKPKLTLRSQRSNSVCVEAPLPGPPGFDLTSGLKAHSRQSSMGSVVMSSNGPLPRTPSISQPSRNSNLSKPKTNSEKTIKPPGSPLLQSQSKARNSSGGSTLTGRTNGQAGNVWYVGGEEKTNRRSPNVYGKMDSGSRHQRSSGMSASTTSQMSKSSIEVDSDNGSEPKLRTLSEIGRSSTFSKDEPTVLGKLDLSLDYSAI